MIVCHLLKVIPVYVAETASKSLRSSMNNVTNISQVTKTFLKYSDHGFSLVKFPLHKTACIEALICTINKQ